MTKAAFEHTTPAPAMIARRFWVQGDVGIACRTVAGLVDDDRSRHRFSRHTHQRYGNAHAGFVVSARISAARRMSCIDPNEKSRSSRRRRASVLSRLR